MDETELKQLTIDIHAEDDLAVRSQMAEDYATAHGLDTGDVKDKVMQLQAELDIPIE